jgi:ribose/xylose/arabinose/galactoside ABC-type transport system permease subunit
MSWSAAGQFLSRYIAYVALIVVVVVFGILSPDRFLTTNNLGIVLQNCAVLAIVAVGITFVIIGGSIDLSVGSVMAFSGAITASTVTSLGEWAFIVGPLVGGILGLMNGLVFVVGRIPSFVVTLGMLSIARGSTVIFTGGAPVPIPLTSSFYVFGTPPAPFLIAASVAAVMGFFLRFTTFGRYTFAIGGDEEKARVLGIPVDRVKLAMFILSGILAGVGGAVLTSQLGSGSPTVGTGFELMAISAVVIGGTPLTGGVGSIIGTAVGSLVITSLANGLIIMGVPTTCRPY